MTSVVTRLDLLSLVFPLSPTTRDQTPHPHPLRVQHVGAETPVQLGTVQEGPPQRGASSAMMARVAAGVELTSLRLSLLRSKPCPTRGPHCPQPGLTITPSVLCHLLTVSWVCKVCRTTQDPE